MTTVQINQPSHQPVFGTLIQISPQHLHVQVGRVVYLYDRAHAAQNRAGMWVVNAFPVIGQTKTANLH